MSIYLSGLYFLRLTVGLKEWVIPQDKIFFDLFERLAAVVVVAAYRLVDLMDDYSDLKTKAHQIEQLEHEGDKITHEIYEQLNMTFITPLEPEEISRLASALDDVLDFIDGTTEKMLNYGITEVDSHMSELAQLILMSVVELENAVKCVRGIKEPRSIEQRCIEVNRLENLADDVLAHAIKDLFKTEDALHIIKYKDIYESMENATDRCEDVANVLSDIAIRHS